MSIRPGYRSQAAWRRPSPAQYQSDARACGRVSGRRRIGQFFRSSPPSFRPWAHLAGRRSGLRERSALLNWLTTTCPAWLFVEDQGVADRCCPAAGTPPTTSDRRQHLRIQEVRMVERENLGEFPQFFSCTQEAAHDTVASVLCPHRDPRRISSAVHLRGWQEFSRRGVLRQCLRVLGWSLEDTCPVWFRLSRVKEEDSRCLNFGRFGRSSCSSQ